MADPTSFTLSAIFPNQKLQANSKGIKREVGSTLMIFAIITLLFIVARFFRITTFSLWGGETFIIDGIRQNWSGMFDYIIADIVHPPLFYVLAKSWVAIGGESLLWLKLLPFLITLAGLPAIFLLGRELNLEPKVLGLALFLIASSGFLIHYAQEFRNYSLLFTLGLYSLWLFVGFHNSEKVVPKQSIPLFFVNLLLIYSHYFGWLIVGLELASLLFWNRRHLALFFVMSAGLLLCFLPWFVLVYRSAIQIGGLDYNLDWIPRPDWRSVLNLLADFSGDLGFKASKVIGILLLGMPIALYGWQICSDYENTALSESRTVYWWLLLVTFAPMIVIFIASQFFRQALWIDRYFIFLVVPYLMLVALSVFNLKSNWMRYGFLSLILIWGIATMSFELITNDVAWVNPQTGSRIPWLSLAEEISNEESTLEDEKVNLFTLYTHSENNRVGDWAIGTSLDFHLAEIGDERFNIVYAGTHKALIEKAIDEEHFWVGYFDLGAERHSEILVQNLSAAGFTIGQPLLEKSYDNQIVLLPVWSANIDPDT